MKSVLLFAARTDSDCLGSPSTRFRSVFTQAFDSSMKCFSDVGGLALFRILVWSPSRWNRKETSQTAKLSRITLEFFQTKEI